MDSSLWSAGQIHTPQDRSCLSHCLDCLVAVGINARPHSGDTSARIETADVVIKAGKPRAYTDIGQANIR